MSRITDEEMRDICRIISDRVYRTYTDDYYSYYGQYTGPELVEYFDKWLEEHDMRVTQAERERLVKEIDASPAVLWAGKGGAKERILEL